MPTILVVEDEPAILELIRVNLQDAGYDVQGAPDAETARTLLRESLPDLVLLDWMLPGQSGLALAKQLRAASPQGASALGRPGGAHARLLIRGLRTDDRMSAAWLSAAAQSRGDAPFGPWLARAHPPLSFATSARIWSADACRTSMPLTTWTTASAMFFA